MTNESTKLNELLPCPFCGSKAEEFFHHKDLRGIGVFKIQCSSKALGCPLYQSFDDVEAWNTRALPPSPAQELVERFEEWEKRYCHLMYLRGEVRDEPSEEIYIQAREKFLCEIAALATSPQDVGGWQPLPQPPKQEC